MLKDSKMKKDFLNVYVTGTSVLPLLSSNTGPPSIILAGIKIIGYSTHCPTSLWILTLHYNANVIREKNKVRQKQKQQQQQQNTGILSLLHGKENQVHTHC